MAKELIVKTDESKPTKATAIIQVIISRRRVRAGTSIVAAFKKIPLALTLPAAFSQHHGDLLSHDLHFHERNAFKKPIRETASIIHRDVMWWETDWLEAEHHLGSNDHAEMLVRLVSPRFILTDQHMVEAFPRRRRIPHRWLRFSAQGIVKLRGKRVFQRIVLNAATTIGPPAADLFTATKPHETIKADFNKPYRYPDEEWD